MTAKWLRVLIYFGASWFPISLNKNLKVWLQVQLTSLLSCNHCLWRKNKTKTKRTTETYEKANGQSVLPPCSPDHEILFFNPIYASDFVDIQWKVSVFLAVPQLFSQTKWKTLYFSIFSKWVHNPLKFFIRPIFKHIRKIHFQVFKGCCFYRNISA